MKRKTYRCEWVAQLGYVDQYGERFNPDWTSEPFSSKEEAKEELKKQATWNGHLMRWETNRDYYEGRVIYREILESET